MKNLKLIGFLLLVLVFLPLYLLPFTLEEILEKNIQAAGGKDRLSAIKNFSFRIGDFTYFMRGEGNMKIVRGKKPVCFEVVVVKGDEVRRNILSNLEDSKGLERVSYICQAKLFSGFFTLSSFGKSLKYNGVKSFGIKKFLELISNIEGANIHFYLDSEDFLLKRLVIDYLTPEKDKHEINYDFGPYGENEGVKIPSSWFISRVGARGVLQEMEEVKFNEELPENFFEDMSLNMGEVRILQGEMKGNIVDFYERMGRLIILTNWTRDCFEKSGIKSGEKLALKISEREFELYFYNSLDEARASGAFQKENFISKDPNSELFSVFLQQPGSLRDTIELLLSLEIKKK